MSRAKARTKPKKVGSKRAGAKKAGPKKDAVRAEVRALVHGPSYMTFDDVVADFPMEHINTRPPNVPYTPWHLLEHIRITQRDILEYIEDPEYRLSAWPDDYWPKPDRQADAAAWKKTVADFRRDRAALEKIAADPRVPLGSALPYAPQHTVIRELLIASEHNTYHIGELAILRQVMGTWPARR
jgi:hypothetical protein